MNEVNHDTMDMAFLQLVISLQGAAMQQMGKIVNPMTGEVDRNIGMAKTSINMLEMIAKKTAGNLTEEEDKLIKHVLYELRMNFVDESKKEESQPVTDNKPTEASPPETDSGDEGSSTK